MAEPESSSRPFAGPIALAVLGLAVTASVVGRYFVTSPLWLDEALSVNISKLPPSQLFEALRHDGHPPLYYLMLHGWMGLFGQGDRAVRALSGIISLATFPLAYLVGKRIAGPRLGITTMLVLALSPYAFRYGSETRMYALVIGLVFAGYLSVSMALEEARPRRLAAVTVTTGLLLWSHYWTMWLIAAVGLMVVARLLRARRRDDVPVAAAALRVLVAMAVGGLTFLPWVPTLLYQSKHTGTPWAPGFRPTTLVVTSLTEFAGGPYSEPQVGMLLLTVLVVIGVFGSAIDDHRVELDFTAHPLARRPLAVLLLTVVVASGVGVLNGMGFSPRYASVFFPLFVLLVALGLEQFRGGPVREVVLVLFAVTALAGMFFVVRLDRTQAGVAAAAIERSAPSGVVVTCPDQLGPSVARMLDPRRYDVSTYPRFESPERVDWVDYKQRNSRNDPVAFAQQLLRRAEGRSLYVVYGDKYLTLEGQCQRLIEAVAAGRPAHTIGLPSSEDFYEPMTVVEFGAPGT